MLDGYRVYNTARYVGIAAADLSPSARAWHLTVSGNFVGPYSPFDEPGVVLPPYGLLHLSGSLPLGNLELDAGIRNVLDRAYPELVAGHIVSPGQPRSVHVGVRVRW